MTMQELTVRAGLDGVVAAQTRLSHVDGCAGILMIAGFPVEALALQATFEEVVYLLWHDRLPTSVELTALRAELAARRAVPSEVISLLRAGAAREIPPMDALQMAVGALGLDAACTNDAAALRSDALSLVARIPTIVAAYARLVRGQEPVAPHPDYRHAVNYLYMLDGVAPSAERARGLETYLNTVVDHGLNASTFTARVIISTQSDMVAATVGALGALKGPLHGGAPGPALDMVFAIGDAAQAENHLRQKLERGERLMGFGHRIYKVRDPRADVLAQAAHRLYQADGDMRLYELAGHVERTAVRLLAEYRPGAGLQTNVEFYTALLLHGIGLDSALFTPTFAAGRVAGWTAHCLEQLDHNRIFRPQSAYVGAHDRTWVPVEAR